MGQLDLWFVRWCWGYAAWCCYYLWVRFVGKFCGTCDLILHKYCRTFIRKFPWSFGRAPQFLCLSASHLHDAARPPPSPPTLSQGLPSRSGAERPKGGRQNRPTLPFQHSHSLTYPSCLHIGDNPADRRCRFDIRVKHASVDVLCIFTWNRKCVIWWRAPLIPDQPPLTSHQQIQSRHQPSALERLYFINRQEQY